MPVILSLFVIADGGILKKTRIKQSGQNAERLLREDAVVKDELIYLINASLGHYAWDTVQIVGSDGGLLKTVENPQRLPIDHRHPH